MRRNLTLSSLLFCFLFTKAQNIENFERLKSSGDIPEVFTKFLSEQIAEDQLELEKDKSLSHKNAKEFSAITNYKLQQLIKGGRVLYGDPLTIYANKILDKLKAASDEDLDHVQLLTLKSNEVNAFATHQGVIFMTVGLWGQIENEAQLAFVLAHELTHVYQNHNQLNYQYSKDMVRNSRYGDNHMSNYYQYSKKNENEADEKGFELARKAGYSDQSLYETFNVLLYSYLPIDELPMEYDWLENESFKITEKYILKDMKGISASEDIDDEFHTHPNIANRRENIEELFNMTSKESKGKVFVASDQTSFEATRELARFEMMNIFIRNADYIEGLYHNYILSKQHPNNTFLQNSHAMLWYGITAFENGDGPNYSTSYRKKEGEIQQLYYFLKKLSDAEASTIATKQIWELSLQYPDNSFLQELRKKVLEEFVKNDENKLSSFAKEARNDTKTDTDKDSTALETKSLSKYQKIANKKKKEKSDKLVYYALIDVINDDDFLSESRAARKKIEASKEQIEKLAKRTKPKESSLDINSLIMTTPNYYAQDNRKSINKNINKNDLTESKLVEITEENAEALDISLNFIDNFRDPNFTTENYNDFSLLYDYLAERSQYEGLHFLPYNSQYINTLTDKYGSKYLGMINMYTEISRRPFNAYYMLICAASLYGIPIYLKWQLTKDKATDFDFVVYNLDTHNPAYFSSKYYTVNMSTPLQNAHIYHSLNQISSRK